MKSFFSAVSFLTAFPVPSSWAGEERHLSRSVIYYPLVGLLLGCSVAGLDWLMHHVLPNMVVSVITIAVLILFTRALHLDGLADTFDGFLSSRNRNKMLEVMKDSRIGAMGVISIVIILLIKVTALYSLPREVRYQALILTPFAGRCAILLHWKFLAYARKEGGLASSFQKTHISIGFFLAIISFPLLSYIILQESGLLTCLSTVILTAVFSIYSYRKIGGLTGDTLGAACELAESAFMVSLLASLLV
jgi:adenosylcobinamide-GDP ribazoletransferase